MRKQALNKLIKGEKGQALMIVVLLMLISALVIAPMLAHLSTGLRTGKEVFEERMYGQYAADSGVEDALYRIQRDTPDLPEAWDGPWEDTDPYDNPYTYTMPSEVNGNTIEVTIQPQWVLEGLEDPPGGMTPHADIVMVGDYIGEEDGNGVYQITITYTQDMRTVHIERIGAWLPDGFTYVDGSSNLEAASGHAHCVPTTESHRGGQAIFWDFASPLPTYEELPVENGETVITFQFTPDGRPASAFSWVKSAPMDIHLSWDTDLKFYQITSEAKDVVTSKIITVDAYTAQNELRDLGIDVCGDYRAIGATLMIEGTGHGYNPYDIRYELLGESSATVSDIPSDACVEAAYLYWSAWVTGTIISVDPFPDSCNNFNNWSKGNNWSLAGTPPWNVRFMGKGGASDSARTLTMTIPGTTSLDLSPYVDYDQVRVSWDQSASSGVADDEGLYLAFSGDGGSNWSDDGGDGIVVFLGNNPPNSYTCTIPSEYVTDSFRFKLFWEANNQNDDKVYIDNISVEAIQGVCDYSVTFKVNGSQFYFDGSGDPTQGGGEVTANIEDRHFLENFTGSGVPNGFSYACNKDVTGLVNFGLETTTPSVTNGNGTYAVGAVDGDTGNEWSYAAWSLILIYSSPGIERHQLYLYDDFIYSDMYGDVDFDGDGAEGGYISGFIVPEDVMDADYAAHLTCFVGEGDDYYEDDSILLNDDLLSNAASPSDNVWNSASPGLTQDGIDIDTFEVTYPTLQPGEMDAKVNLPTDVDSWNLVYIILSFYSEVTSGGTVSYLIRG